MRPHSDFSAHTSEKASAAPLQVSLGPTFLCFFHIVVCCVSLLFVTRFYHAFMMTASDNEADFARAALNVAPLALASLLFSISRFSFGYFLSFYFYTMTLGYLWLVQYSIFAYDHTLVAASIFTCALAFLVPSLFIVAPFKQRFVLSAAALERVLTGSLLLAALTILVGASYGFRLVGISQIYNFRLEMEFPVVLKYAFGITSNSLLPFAFACFLCQGRTARAALTLLLLALYYPITLSKIALFAPFWLMLLAVLSRFFQARTVVQLSLFLPMLLGVLLTLLFDSGTVTFQQFISYFSTVNFRMIGLTSSALDFYSDFFSTHPLTHFCQINLLKLIIACPYQTPLSVVMQQTYQIGYFNASLFATEGIASVGPEWAPISIFVCALVIALGNRASSNLPERFVLLSGGVLPQIFLNVPLTISLVTNGAAALFLLWYITPPSIFENRQ